MYELILFRAVTADELDAVRDTFKAIEFHAYRCNDPMLDKDKPAKYIVKILCKELPEVSSYDYYETKEDGVICLKNKKEYGTTSSL